MIKANEPRVEPRQDEETQRVLRLNAGVTVHQLVHALADGDAARLLEALVEARADALEGQTLRFPETGTGPVGSGALPVRMVTLRDAKVITACLETCMRLNALLLEEGVISTPIGRGELERIVRDLEAGQ
jgi:hypothetical protein